MRKVCLVLVLSLFFSATSSIALADDGAQPAAPAGGDMNSALASIQDQIQQVSNSIPDQIQKAQASNKQQAAAQQKAIQDQLAHLQDEISQLQAQNQQAIAGLQKEIKELEEIK